MSNIFQEILFNDAHLDFDSDYRFTAMGGSRWILNMITNQHGSEFVVKNFLGNTAYSHSFEHSMTYHNAVYTVIGDCYDEKRNAVYFFIYSDLTNHSIIRFNFADGSFDKIAFDHTNLGLDIDYPITDAFMIGDWLHYNPRSSSPRSINVEWAYLDWYANPTGGAGNWTIGDLVKSDYGNKIYRITASGIPKTSSFWEIGGFEFYNWTYNDLDSSLDYVRYRDFYNTTSRFLSSPLIEYGQNVSREYNNIRNHVFQFAYRYYIPEQGYTNVSVFSPIIGSRRGENFNGENPADITYDNYIAVYALYQLSGLYEDDATYSKIEFLVREGPNNPWYVFQTLENDYIMPNVVNRFNASYIRAIFYNDKAYLPVDDLLVGKPDNPLPILANSQWSLDGVRSAYGRITEGFNGVFTNVTLTAGYEEVDIPLYDSGALEETFTGSGVYYYEFSIVDKVVDSSGRRTTRFKYSLTITDVTGVAQNEIIIITINGIEYKGIVTNATPTATNYAEDIAGVVSQHRQIQATAASGVITFWLSRQTSIQVRRFGSAATSEFVAKYRSFKGGANHPFCLFYFDDALRRSDPVVDDDMVVYVPALPEIGESAGTNFVRKISWEVNHIPPSEAKYWCWGYAGNRTIGKFWQYNIEDLTDPPANTNYADYIGIEISGLQTIGVEGNGKDNFFAETNIEPYEFQEGDRIRFLTMHDGGTQTAYDDVTIAAEGLDFEIKAFDDINHILYIDDSALTITDYDGKQTLVEIYRPLKQTGETIYFEFGDLYRVFADSGSYYHAGQTADQSDYVSNGATGVFGGGDICLITRAFATKPFGNAYDPMFVESYSWSDFYDSEGWGKGKFGIVSGFGRRQLNAVRFSNKFIPNTESSALATFDGFDYIELSDQFGEIMAMRQAGHTLLVIFERNSAGVLVNKTQLYDAEGGSQVINSDKVLANPEYSNYHYGTIFPESVILVDRTVYFFDIYRKEFIRHSSNGMFPISKYKMRKYFSDKSVALITSGVENVSVRCMFDFINNLLYVSFIDYANQDNNETLIFEEGPDKWKCFTDLYLDEEDTELMSMVDDSLGTSPDLSLATTFLSDVYTSIITALSAGTYNDDEDFTGSYIANVRKGDKIVITAYIAAQEYLGQMVYLKVTGTGGVSSINQLLATYSDSDNPYSNTQTITSDGTIHVTFRVSGNNPVGLNETVNVYWTLTHTRKNYPTFGHGVSKLVSYMDENVYVHNNNTTRCNFYGYQYNFEIDVIGNENANLMKIFDSLGIHSNNDDWVVESIDIPADIKHPNGMYSRLPNAAFEHREGAMFSEFWRNMKTSSATASVLELREGDVLRGYIVIIRLTNDATTEVALFKVDINSTKSDI